VLLAGNFCWGSHQLKVTAEKLVCFSPLDWIAIFQKKIEAPFIQREKKAKYKYVKIGI